jgi:hypothetical protein
MWPVHERLFLGIVRVGTLSPHDFRRYSVWNRRHGKEQTGGPRFRTGLNIKLQFGEIEYNSADVWNCCGSRVSVPWT